MAARATMKTIRKSGFVLERGRTWARMDAIAFYENTSCGHMQTHAERTQDGESRKGGIRFHDAKVLQIEATLERNETNGVFRVLGQPKSTKHDTHKQGGIRMNDVKTKTA